MKLTVMNKQVLTAQGRRGQLDRPTHYSGGQQVLTCRHAPVCACTTDATPQLEWSGNASHISFENESSMFNQSVMNDYYLLAAARACVAHEHDGGSGGVAIAAAPALANVRAARLLTHLRAHMPSVRTCIGHRTSRWQMLITAVSPGACVQSNPHAHMHGHMPRVHVHVHEAA